MTGFANVKSGSLLGRIGMPQRMLLLLAVAILPLAALLAVLLWLDHDQTLVQARSNLRDAARLAAASQSSVFGDARATLAALRLSPDVQKGSADCSQLMAAVKAANPQFNTIGVFDAGGMVTCHSTMKHHPAFGDTDILGRARQRGAPDFLVGHFIIGRASGKPTIVTLMPLPTATGEFAGAVFASLNLEHLAERSQGVSDGGKRVVVMIEPGTDRLLTRYPPLPVPYGTAFPGHPLPHALRVVPSGGTVETKGFDGVERVYGFAPVPGAESSGIMLAVGEPLDALMAPLRFRLILSVSVLAMILILASIGTWWFGNRTYLQPINRLMKTARLIGSGAHGAKAALEAWQAPEFRRFGQSLEEMGVKLAAGKQAEEAVAERNRYLLVAERLAEVGYWGFDPATMQTTWSDEIFRIYDLPIAAVPPPLEHMIAAYHAGDRALMRASLEAAIHFGKEYSIQLRLIRPSGDVRHVMSRACVERDASGKVVLVYGALLDITQVKRAELEAHAANVMLIMAEEIAEVGHWRVDRRSGALAWSDQVYRMHGLDPATYQATVEGAIQAYHPEDRDGVVATVEAAVEQRQSFEFRKRIVRSDGTIRHVVSRGRCEIDSHSGEVEAIFGVIIDVTAQRAAEDGLKDSELRYRMLVENASDMIFRLDRNFVRTYVSPASAEILGFAPEDLVGQVPVNMMHPDDVASVSAVYADVMAGLERAEITNRIRHRDGHWVWVEVELRALRDPASDAVVGILGALRDISDRKHAEDLVAASEARFRMLSENTADFVTHVDATGRRVFASPAAFDLLGYMPEELIGGRPIDLAYAEDRPALEAMLGRLRQGDPSDSVQYRARRKTGDYRWIEASGRPLGTEKGYVLALRDVDRRKKVEDELEMAVLRLNVLAHSDGLTGLANRRSFDEMLDKELTRAATGGTAISLLLADVDHFKAYNDTYGHSAGDTCLRQVAGLLGSVVRRPTDLAARYGGEEFAAIMPETDEEGAFAVAEGFRKAVAASVIEHRKSGHGVVTISVGIVTIVPSPGHTLPTTMIEAADSALYAAKGSGRNCVRRFKNEAHPLAKAV